MRLIQIRDDMGVNDGHINVPVEVVDTMLRHYMQPSSLIQGAQAESVFFVERPVFHLHHCLVTVKVAKLTVDKGSTGLKFET